MKLGIQRSQLTLQRIKPDTTNKRLASTRIVNSCHRHQWAATLQLNYLTKCKIFALLSVRFTANSAKRMRCKLFYLNAF